MDFALPVAWTLILWWASTGAILYLVRLSRSKLRPSLAAMTAGAIAALAGLAFDADDTSVTGAYLSFTCSLVIWGWLETTFLTGLLTGPRTAACSHPCRGWRRFVHATEAIIYHELAIAGTAAVIFMATLGGENSFGMWTFLVLWIMRLSAKLNLFLGVRNASAEFLPERLRYLSTFFALRPMNALFPFSAALGTAVTVLLVQAALSPVATAGETTGYTLLATLMALAVVEHLLMMLPLRASALWQWGLNNRGAD